MCPRNDYTASRFSPHITINHTLDQPGLPRKSVTRQAIVAAINRGDIDGSKLGPRTLVVIANAKFEAWTPNRVRQAAGKARRKATGK